MCIYSTASLRAELSKIKKIRKSFDIREKLCSFMLTTQIKGMSGVVCCGVSHECLGHWPWLLDDPASEYSRVNIQEFAVVF